MIAGEEVTQEYRVETRQQSDPSGTWVPEGGPGHVYPTREEVERVRGERADWYGNPDRWAHRVTVRSVTRWMEVSA